MRPVIKAARTLLEAAQLATTVRVIIEAAEKCSSTSKAVLKSQGTTCVLAVCNGLAGG
jgi:hypothetical protein